MEAPSLAHSVFSQCSILNTDASDLAIGAVPSQTIDGKEDAIEYASETLTKSGIIYCVTRKELL